MSAGRTRCPSRFISSSRIKLFWAKKRRTCQRGAQLLGEAFGAEKWGVDSVHTLGP